MSIGRKLIDLARAELNSLLDRASTSDGGGGDDPDEDLYRRYSLDTLTDAQLEAELERRRKAREAAARARTARATPGAGSHQTRPNTGPRPSSSSSSSSSSHRPPPSRPLTHAEEVRRAYAALEVPYGADFEVVRKSYRALMRKYHPDKHGQSPERQKAANELAQRLSQAYSVLSQHLKKK